VVSGLLLTLFASALFEGCVGDEPSGQGPPASDAGNANSGDGSQTAFDGGTSGGGNEGGSGPRCNPSNPFTKVEIVKGLSTPEEDRDVWISGDELTAYVVVNGKIRKSTRASVAAEFAAPTEPSELAVVNGATPLGSPSLTADGLVIVVAYNGPDSGVLVGQRTSTASPFGPLATTTTRASRIGRSVAFIAPNGGSLFLASNITNQPADIREAPRDVNTIYGDGGFLDWGVTKSFEALDTSDDETRAVVDKDAVRVVFASSRSPGAIGNHDLYAATRAAMTGDFGVPVRLADPISSPQDDLPVALSDDGCALYLTSARPGGVGGVWDVWVATKAP
jgi:hypothetical protein